MNLFFKILEWQGYPMVKAINDLLSVQSLEAPSFDEWVKGQREKQFDFFKKNNAFYQSFLSRNGGDKAFFKAPILSKREVQRPLMELISTPFIGKKLFVNNTSGSSGTPFFFAKDKYAHAMTWALIRDRYRWHGIEYGKSLQARFYGIPLKGKKYYIEKIKDLIATRVRFPVFDLSEEKLWEFIERFKKLPFEYLNGYTSSLVYFAEFCIENKIVLKDICPTLKVCFPTSEMCSPQDRKIMEKGFGVRVAVEYGAAEMDVIAYEDQDGDWIVSNENVFLEIVDDNGNPVPNGQEGRIILTSLYNQAIPLYRYEVGDIGIIRPERKGKYQVLEKLIGRTNEFAILPSGRKVPALTFYYITKTLIQEQFKIKEFVIRQTGQDTYTYEYVADKELTSAVKESILEAMNTYLETGLKAKFEKRDFIERGRTGKLKQFFREF
ncbi:AMP-binding protein [Cecembia rubra]|uniref:Phenylacetate-CoA ligase n=1 Tax=Cecembia rubra TaxID=1485585 RepID=A0A2P8E3B6_9BACT|nr:AMP-binding protein [Cecembia rubra]PSL03963.1 phenylacetate-CoA ligase [Cecembia rubra]